MSDEKSTIWEIILDKWVPALITAGVGGLMVALIVPGIQSEYVQQSALKERKIELWETLSENFTNYILYRGRLNSIAKEENKRRSSGIEISIKFMDRKEEYRIQRDRYANNLRRDFLFAEYYYSDDVAKLIKDYITWHKQFRIATVDKLPPTEVYTQWRDKIVVNIRSALEGES